MLSALILGVPAAHAAESAAPAGPGEPVGLRVARGDGSALRLVPELEPPRASLSLVAHLGVAATAGVVAVPSGLLLARWLGHLSNHTLVAGLSGLAGMALFAPAVVTLVAWAVWGPPRAGAWPLLRAAGLTVLANAIALGVAAFAGLSLGSPLGVILFTVADGALLGGAAVAGLRAFGAPPSKGATGSVEVAVAPLAGRSGPVDPLAPHGVPGSRSLPLLALAF